MDITPAGYSGDIYAGVSPKTLKPTIRELVARRDASLMAARDIRFSFLSAFMIGLLTLPVLKIVNIDLNLKTHFIIVPVFLLLIPIGLGFAKAISCKMSLFWPMAKFAVIGTLNTLVDWGTLLFLTLSFRQYTHIDPSTFIVSGITMYSFYRFTSFMVSVVNSYFWNKHWTFYKSNVDRSGNRFLSFLFASIIGCGINVAVSSYLYSNAKPASITADQWGLFSAGFGTLCGLIWNFIIYKVIVFKN
jgi:putative flippase GtrA